MQENCTVNVAPTQTPLEELTAFPRPIAGGKWAVGEGQNPTLQPQASNFSP